MQADSHYPKPEWVLNTEEAPAKTTWFDRLVNDDAKFRKALGWLMFGVVVTCWGSCLCGIVKFIFL